MAAARLRLGDPDDLGRDSPEGGLRCAWRRRDEDGKNDAAPRFDRRPSAGKAGQIGPDSARRRLDGDAARLQLRLGIAHAAAGEHRVDRLRRCGVARDAHVVPGGADGGDRHHADAKIELQFLGDEVGGRGHCGACRFGGFAGNREHRPVAPEHEGEGDAAERVADGADDRGARHVDVLVAPRPQRVGRLHDIGSADLPVIGKGREDARVADALEGVEDRQVFVAKAGAHAARLALPRRFLLEAEQLLRLPEALEAMQAHRAPEFWLDRRDLARGKHARADSSSSASRSARPRSPSGRWRKRRGAPARRYCRTSRRRRSARCRNGSARAGGDALGVDLVGQHERLVQRLGDLAA